MNRIADGVVRNSGQVRNTTQDGCGTLITVSKMSTSSVHGGGDDNYHDCEPYISIVRSAGDPPLFTRSAFERGENRSGSSTSVLLDRKRKNVKCKKKNYLLRKWRTKRKSCIHRILFFVITLNIWTRTKLFS